MLSFISTAMRILCVLCMLAIPVFAIIFIVLWIMKKKKLWIGISTGICFLGVIITALIGSQADLWNMTPEERAVYYEHLEQEKEQRKAEKEKAEAEKKAAEEKKKEEKLADDKTKTEAKTETGKKEENVLKEESTSVPKVTSSVVTFTDEEIMVMQFKTLGLTEAEAKEAQKIFENVGITQISNISKPLGSGIDGDQTYVCWFFGFNPNVDCIKVGFRIVKRKIQGISICFSPYGKLGEFPTSHKYKELTLLDGIKEDTYSDSVTLYNKKLKNYAVDENSVGYRAVYDRETHSISKYK